jgi:repressor LexA
MELSQRQTEVYQFIIDYHQKRGYSPAIREIAAGVGLAPGTVTAHIHALKDKGCVDWEPNSARSLHIVKQGVN